MQIVLAVLSILMITAAATLARRALLPALCPLCAGVAGTWMGLLAALYAGWPVDPRLPAILLGGSVVGLAGLGEKLMTRSSDGAVLLWKTVFVTVGFAGAWFLTVPRWGAAAANLAVLALLLGILWLRRPGPASEAGTARIDRIEEQLKRCC